MMHDSNSDRSAAALFVTADLVFGAAGLFFLMLGLVWTLWCLSWNGGSQVTTGKVVRMVYAEPGQGKGARPQVEYQVDGQAYQITSAIPANPPAHAVGDAVSIRYEQSAPGAAVIDSLIDRWLFPLAFSTMGAIFTGIGGRAMLRLLSRLGSMGATTPSGHL